LGRSGEFQKISARLADAGRAQEADAKRRQRVEAARQVIFEGAKLATAAARALPTDPARGLCFPLHGFRQVHPAGVREEDLPEMRDKAALLTTRGPLTRDRATAESRLAPQAGAGGVDAVTWVPDRRTPDPTWARDHGGSEPPGSTAARNRETNWHKPTCPRTPVFS